MTTEFCKKDAGARNFDVSADTDRSVLTREEISYAYGDAVCDALEAVCDYCRNPRGELPTECDISEIIKQKKHYQPEFSVGAFFEGLGIAEQHGLVTIEAEYDRGRTIVFATLSEAAHAAMRWF